MIPNDTLSQLNFISAEIHNQTKDVFKLIKPYAKKLFPEIPDYYWETVIRSEVGKHYSPTPYLSIRANIEIQNLELSYIDLYGHGRYNTPATEISINVFYSKEHNDIRFTLYELDENGNYHCPLEYHNYLSDNQCCNLYDSGFEFTTKKELVQLMALNSLRFVIE